MNTTNHLLVRNFCDILTASPAVGSNPSWLSCLHTTLIVPLVYSTSTLWWLGAVG